MIMKRKIMLIQKFQLNNLNKEVLFDCMSFYVSLLAETVLFSQKSCLPFRIIKNLSLAASATRSESKPKYFLRNWLGNTVMLNADAIIWPREQAVPDQSDTEDVHMSYMPEWSSLTDPGATLLQ